MSNTVSPLDDSSSRMNSISSSTAGRRRKEEKLQAAAAAPEDMGGCPTSLSTHPRGNQQRTYERTTISEMAVPLRPSLIVIVVVVIVVLLQCARRYQRQTRGYFSMFIFIYKWLRVVLYTGHLVFSSCLIRKNSNSNSNEKRGQQRQCLVVSSLKGCSTCCCCCCYVPFSGGRLPFSLFSLMHVIVFLFIDADL